MNARPVAPVIPSPVRLPASGTRRAGPIRPLPAATAPVIPAAPQDVLYGFGRIDASGRVGDRAVTSALGWQPGDRLTLTAAAGVITVRRAPDGMASMPAKPYVAIPAALRRRCGLRPGDRVLLAMCPAQDKLAAYSFAVIDQVLRAHASFPGAEAGRS